MEQASAAPHHAEHEPTSTGLSHRKLLIWAFLASDCMFFGSLIATYLVYRGKSLSGPLPIDVFDIPVTSISTFVLLMSSMGMVLSYAALRRGNIKAFRIWLASTALMGMTFLAFQVFEFRSFANHEVVVECAELIAHPEDFTALEHTVADARCAEGAIEVEETVGLTLRTNLFGTTFYTLTGLHGAHVTLGVIWLLSLLFYSFRGGVTSARHLDLDLAALYWHFVDIVWIVIFTVVYLFGVFPGFES